MEIANLKTIVSFLLLLICSNSFPQLKPEQFRTNEHPRVFATKEDKQALWDKIQNTAWAGDIYKKIKEQVDPLVEHHVNDPQFIVSRLQMNWEEGKHYTDFRSKGNFIPQRSGNAPYPTVRVTYARSAAGSTPAPPYDKITPYGNGDLMKLVNGEWVTVPFSETGLGAENVNQKIIEDAYRAGIVYYFTGDKKYAKCAADILWTFIRGASYNNQVNPDQEGGSMGYLSFETLGDTRRFATLPLALDFIHDYLFGEYFDSPEFLKGRKGELWAPGHPQGKSWALDRIHIMFEKFMDNKLTRGGGLIGNWNTNEHESALLYALALDNNDQYADGKGREYYVSKFLYGPTTEHHGAYADLTKSNISPETGLWPEPPGGYGQNSISQLVRLGYFYYINGIDVLKSDSLLRKAALSFPQVAFSNGRVTNWGDASYSALSAEQAELMLAYAHSTNDKQMQDNYSALLKFAGKRELSGIYYSPLFFYAKDLNETSKTFTYPRVSYSREFSLILERNNASVYQDALQYNVYGFGKKTGHRHANGMAMELYARGMVLGVDPGAGPDYWVDQHVRYNSRTAAHNTVMPNGESAELNMTQDLKIMYAEPEVKAGIDPAFQVSPNFQFTDTYNDFTNSNIKADQRRVMGIVRTGSNQGYFVDIFRSRMRDSEDKYHDYIYHNIGTGLGLYDQQGKPLPLTNESIDSTSGFGYKYFANSQSVKTIDAFYGIFSTGINDIQMRTWMPGNSDRTVYNIKGPATARYYMKELTQIPTPVLLVRQKGEAWNHPFIAVYEPYGNGTNAFIKSVRRMKEAPLQGDFTGLIVERENGSDFILNSADPMKPASYEGTGFKGIYGIISYNGSTLTELYLGTGFSLTKDNFGIFSGNTSMVQAGLIIKDDKIYYSSNGNVTIEIPCSNREKIKEKNITITYETPEGPKEARTTISKAAKGIVILRVDLPAGKNIQLTVSKKAKK